MFSLALDNALPPRWQPHRQTFPLLPLLPPPPPPPLCCWVGTGEGLGGKEWGDGEPSFSWERPFIHWPSMRMEAMSLREDPRIIVIMVNVQERLLCAELWMCLRFLNLGEG